MLPTSDSGAPCPPPEHHLSARCRRPSACSSGGPHNGYCRNPIPLPPLLCSKLLRQVNRPEGRIRPPRGRIRPPTHRLCGCGSVAISGGLLPRIYDVAPWVAAWREGTVRGVATWCRPTSPISPAGRVASGADPPCPGLDLASRPSSTAARGVATGGGPSPGSTGRCSSPSQAAALRARAVVRRQPSGLVAAAACRVGGLYVVCGSRLRSIGYRR